MVKYQDSVNRTEVSVEHYSDIHFKVWCIEGSNLDLRLWSKLVVCFLDEPFRALFAEAVGGKMSRND